MNDEADNSRAKVSTTFSGMTVHALLCIFKVLTTEYIHVEGICRGGGTFELPSPPPSLPPMENISIGYIGRSSYRHFTFLPLFHAVSIQDAREGSPAVS